LLLLTLPGTPFLYYGDELGMGGTVIPDAHARDPWGQNVSYLSRDGCRPPMQWTAGPNDGLTSPGGLPWLPLAPQCQVVNGEPPLAEPDSILNMYRRLLTLRKKSDALRSRDFASPYEVPERLLVYTRGEDEMTVILNFGDVVCDAEVEDGTVVFSTHRVDREGEAVSGGRVSLGSLAGVIVAHG